MSTSLKEGGTTSYPFGGYGLYFKEMERLGQLAGLPEAWANKLIQERKEDKSSGNSINSDERAVSLCTPESSDETPEDSTLHIPKDEQAH